MVTYQTEKRRGAVTIQVAFALVVLIIAAAFCFDIGQTVVAAQIAQRTADAAALAGATKLMTGAESEASSRASGIVSANGTSCIYPLSLQPTGVMCYSSGQAISGYRTLGIGEEAICVPVQAKVPFYFAKIIGLESTIVKRSATAARVYAAGAPIVPMWISAATPLTNGVTTELHASTAAIEPIPPGNFGWLTPPAGDFTTLLSGANIPEATRLANYVKIGDAVTALPGQKVGQWEKVLKDRLSRASVPPYSTQTPTEGGYTDDNPRILIVPLVTVSSDSGSGSNATFRVEQFGVFWLESVEGGSSKSILGRFLRFDVPLQPDSSVATGVWTVRLVG